MKFRKLAEIFERLEQTASRNEMTQILSDLLRETNADEVAEIVYLSLGNLGPSYARVQFNLAEKQVVKSLARAFAVDEKQVTKRYKEIGDLGELVQKMAGDREESEMTVEDVYNKLMVIAKDVGGGSQDRKIQGLAELVERLDGLSARYVVRVVLGRLRLGFLDKTVLDAISWMEKGDKSEKAELELAYQIRPDIGWLVEQVKRKGTKEAIKNVEAELGVPIMPMLCQRLKSTDEMVKKMGEVAVEPKFDGTRCVAGSTGVLAKGRGYISVRELRVGDLVLSHKGRFRKVEDKTFRSRRRGERIFRFQTYLGDEMKVSEGHKFLIHDGEKLRWVPIENIDKQWVYFPRPNITADVVPENRKFIDKAGYEKTLILDENFFRFLGYWIGDGLSNNNHQTERVGLVFNAKHLELIEIYEKIIRESLLIKEISTEIRNGAAVLYWRDPIFRKWLCEHFRGVKESGKKIPEWFFGLDKKRFQAFMRGWRESDGTSRNGGGNRIVTKERQMVMMAQILGFKYDMPMGIRRTRNSAYKGGVKKTYYELITSGTDRYVKAYKEGYVIKVKKIVPYKQASHRLRLYDIQVKNDKSFCISVASLHNCQIHFKRGKNGFVRTFTRNLEETSQMFPELFKMGDHVDGEGLVLDSEAIGYDPKTGKLLPFQTTITRKRKHGIEETATKVPLKFFVFDVMYRNGESLINKSYEERRKILKEVVKDKDLLVVDDYWVTDDPKRIKDKHEELLKEGMEGVIVKDMESKYVPGRTGWRWVKMKEVEESHAKLSDTLDCVVMGYYKGKGKRTVFGLGAFLVGVRKGDEIVTIAKIGTGLSDEQFREMKDRLDKLVSVQKPKGYVVDKNLEPDAWVDPGLVVEIAADEVTKSPIHSAGVALRFPRLIKFRDDKDINGVTTVEEVEAIS